MTTLFCTECGTALATGYKFCGSCGTLTSGNADIDTPASSSLISASAPVNVLQVSAPAAQSEPEFTAPRSPTTTSASAVFNQTLLIGLPTKSVGVAILLAVFFGPLGMFYSTVAGAITMLVVSFIVALISFGIGLFITWPICIIWAAIAVNNHNAQITKTSNLQV